jgi:hypothetical protein
VRGRQSACRGLVPPSHLDALGAERDAEARRTRLARNDGSVVNPVAEHGGEVAGWARHGPCRDGGVRTRTPGCVRPTWIRSTAAASAVRC